MEIFRSAPGEPATDFRTLVTSDLPWVENEHPGFWTKDLFDDGAGNVTTLMRVDAGAFVGPHAHDETEQVYVVEGSFYDQVRTYHAGDFVERRPGAVHATGSEEGATVLLIFCSA